VHDVRRHNKRMTDCVEAVVDAAALRTLATVLALVVAIVILPELAESRGT
jgi:predicted membrane protein